MRDRNRYLLLTTAAVTLGAAGTLAAHADWFIPGTATVRARTATMPRGGTPDVTKQSRTVVVSWSAQEIGPGTTMDRYLVTAHSVEDPPMADVGHEVAASGADTESTVFTADEVSGGRWYWTVVPKFHRWTGERGGQSDLLTIPTAPTRRADSTRSVPAPAEPTPAPTTATPRTETTTTVAPSAPPADEPDTGKRDTGKRDTGKPAPTESFPAPAEPSGDAPAPAVASG